MILLTCPTTPDAGYACRAGAPSHHRTVKNSERTIPLLVADYGFRKNSDDDTTMTLLIMRVYPYKIYMCCAVPGKGRDPQVVARIVRFIKETGLTHFA